MSSVQGPERYHSLLEQSSFYRDLESPPRPSLAPDLSREQYWRCLCQAVSGTSIPDDVWAPGWQLVLKTILYPSNLDRYEVTPSDTPTDVLCKIFDPVFAALRDIFSEGNRDHSSKYSSARVQKIADILFAGHWYFPWPDSGTVPHPLDEGQKPSVKGVQADVRDLYLDFGFGQPGTNVNYTTVTEAIVANADGELPQGSTAARLLRDAYSKSLALPRRVRYTFKNNTHTAACPTWNHLPFRFYNYDFIEPTERQRHPPNADLHLPSVQGTWIGAVDDFRILVDSPEFRTFLSTCPRWRTLLEVSLSLLRSYVFKAYRFIPPVRLDIDVIIWCLREASQIVSERGIFDDRPTLGPNGEADDQSRQGDRWIGPEPAAILPVQWEGSGTVTCWKQVILGSIEKPAPVILKFLLYSLSDFRSLVVESLGVSIFNKILGDQIAMGTASVEDVAGRLIGDGTITLDNYLPMVPQNNGAFTGIFIHEFMQRLVLNGDYNILHHPHLVTKRETYLGRYPGVAHPSQDPQIPLFVVANINTVVSHVATQQLSFDLPAEQTFKPPEGVFMAINIHQLDSERRTQAFYSRASNRKNIDDLEHQWLYGAGSGLKTFSRWHPVPKPVSEDLTRPQAILANGPTIQALLPFEERQDADLSALFEGDDFTPSPEDLDIPLPLPY